MIMRGYTNGPYGQVHWRMHEQVGARCEPDLYCLHPAPFSGLTFTTIMPFLAEGRRIIAPDYPGHGGSDPLGAAPSVSDYARAMLPVIDAVSDGQDVDLLGFHTGCLVAAELGSIRPDRVRRIVLIDIPYFDVATRSDIYGEAAKPFAITADLGCLAAPWERGMTRRIESQGVARSFDLFTEQLRHGVHMNAAFHAAKMYDCKTGFSRLSKPVTVVASRSALLDATLAAAQAIPGANLIERLDISRAVLDESAETLATTIIEGLI